MKINRAKYYLRNPEIIAIAGEGGYLFSGENNVTHFPTSHCDDWSKLLQDLMTPIRGDALLNKLGEYPDELCLSIGSLLGKNVIIESNNNATLLELQEKLFTENQGYYLKKTEPKCNHLVVGMTGSIMSGLMAPIILSLCYCGFHRKIDVILTQPALKFANRDLFEHYGIRTWVDPFEKRDGIHVPHISLAKSADAILVMPASANLFHRIAAGTCTDLISLTIAATSAPVMMAPVMNTAMLNHRAIARNIAQTRKDGFYVMEPTLFFEASELVHQGAPMYGAPGSFWQGARGLMNAISAVIDYNERGAT